MKIFVLYWFDGKKTEIKGLTFTDACNKAGYSPAALTTLDFYEEGRASESEYTWEPNSKAWRKPSKITNFLHCFSNLRKEQPIVVQKEQKPAPNGDKWARRCRRG